VLSAALEPVLFLLVVVLPFVVDLLLLGREGFFCCASADSITIPNTHASKNNLIMRFFIVPYLLFQVK
jgi:hypothetical protein